MSFIYEHPQTYDLEHSGPQQDLGFLLRFARHHQPVRILEYACGNGRLTSPVAEAAAEWGGSVTGIDSNQTMLASAKSKPNLHGITWESGDIQTWKPPARVDLIISFCGSLSHLLTIDDQITTWRNAFASLAPGGRFLIVESAPDYNIMADAMRSPARTAVCLDGDFDDGQRRLLRCRAAQYGAHSQTLRVRYLYDQLETEEKSARFVDDYDAHVYFPNELRLLFTLTGFRVEGEWGDFAGSPFSHLSRSLIICGQRRESSEIQIETDRTGDERCSPKDL